MVVSFPPALGDSTLTVMMQSRARSDPKTRGQQAQGLRPRCFATAFLRREGKDGTPGRKTLHRAAREHDVRGGGTPHPEETPLRDGRDSSGREIYPHGRLDETL